MPIPWGLKVYFHHYDDGYARELFLIAQNPVLPILSPTQPPGWRAVQGFVWVISQSPSWSRPAIDHLSTSPPVSEQGLS